VALWHLSKHTDRLKGSPHPEGLRRAIGGLLPEKVKGVAVFTNQTCDATQVRKVEDGVHLRTLWGELGYPLGGEATPLVAKGSIHKSAYAYTKKHVSPKEGVGNKSRSLSNRPCTVLNAQLPKPVERRPDLSSAGPSATRTVL
jgi:hypothetical protein